MFDIDAKSWHCSIKEQDMKPARIEYAEEICRPTAVELISIQTKGHNITLRRYKGTCESLRLE